MLIPILRGRNLLSIMIIRLYFLITVIIHHSLSPKFCRAQGNTNSSTGPCGRNGECGAFGSCNAQESPICSCLPGFNPQNTQEWDSRNWSSGCLRRVALNCGSGATNDGFLKLQSMKVSGYSARWFGPKDQCEGRCLTNCSCLAYAFDVGIGCMFWSATLLDVQEFNNGLGSDLNIRVSVSELGNFFIFIFPKISMLFLKCLIKGCCLCFILEEMEMLLINFLILYLDLCENLIPSFYFLLFVNG